jgi:START domain
MVNNFSGIFLIYLGRIFHLTLWTILVGASTASAQGAWVLKKQEDGIKVYSRSIDTLKIKELKVEFSLKAKLSDLAAVILDIPNYFQWSYNTKMSYVIRRVSSSEMYFYSEIASPWPANYRDLVVHQQIRQDKATKMLTILSESVPDMIPPKPHVVRVPFSKETWLVNKMGDNSINIEYYLAIDPGAAAPAWLINLFSAVGPLESFKMLSVWIQQLKYQQKRIDFIEN